MKLSEWAHAVPINLEAERPREWFLTQMEAEAFAREIVRRAAGNSPHDLRRWITRVFNEVLLACSAMEEFKFQREKAEGLWNIRSTRTEERVVGDVAAAVRALEEL